MCEFQDKKFVDFTEHKPRNSKKFRFTESFPQKSIDPFEPGNFKPEQWWGKDKHHGWGDIEQA